jgi:hypothetical protein
VERVRHHHFGEGSYEQSEMILQELMAEVGSDGIDRQPVSVEGRGLEAAADWRNLGWWSRNAMTAGNVAGRIPLAGIGETAESVCASALDAPRATDHEALERRFFFALSIGFYPE